MFEYIVRLSTRGAPLIACSAALALAIHTVNAWPNDPEFEKKAEYLKSSRPTAVNLAHACDILTQKGSEKKDFSPENICRLAYGILEEDKQMCQRMGEFGASLVQEGENLMHYCNTGSLATMGIGTALGVIREAHRQGKKIHVYVCETRPLLQGGRLTAYELQKEGIPYTLICDNMAAQLMREKKIQRVFVGADRVALNGDVANKIGTYNMAVIAKFHNIPFHPVAPLSTVDFTCPSGADIHIEHRSATEVRGAFGVQWAPAESPTHNPCFDVTPVDLISSLVLDVGVVSNEELKKGDIIKYKK